MIRDFAEFFSLTIWDWFAAFIAVISLVVAICAYVIARKTYAVSKLTLTSQRKTEKNTAPIINLEIQEFLLKQLVYQLFFKDMDMAALGEIVKTKKQHYYVPTYIWNKLTIRDGFIHTELFYNDSESFGTLNELQDAIITYNQNIASVKELVALNMNSDTIIHLLKKGRRMISSMILQYVTILSGIYKKESDDISSPLNRMLFMMAEDEKKKHDDINDYSPKYFEKQYPFLVFNTKGSDSNLILMMADRMVEETIERFEDDMIELTEEIK